MASSAYDNAFMQEKENQQQIFSVIGRLIFNISQSVMPDQLPEGMSLQQVRPVLENLNLNQGRVESLKTTLARKKMKVVMFGETSSGKSMVINAMLGKELLVCGMGDATNCFLTIEEKEIDENDVPRSPGPCRPPSYCGSVSQFTIRRSTFAQCSRRSELARATGYKENFKYPLNVKNLHALSDASSAESLDVSFNIDVSLAGYDHRCSLLSNYLQIVDCPGVSTDKQLGDHVKDFCGDADVHVLIVDSMIGITVQGKEHFLRVKERLPNPDIIIGFTQWDRSANEEPERKNRVKQKHLEAAFELLKSTGTHVSNMDQATKRCFFISGKEALDNALGEQAKYVQGQQERAKAFSDFMRKIEERACIAGKKAKLNMNRQSCRDILISCIGNIKTLIEWISQTINVLVIEIRKLQAELGEMDRRTDQYRRKSREQREKALNEFEGELMDCMDTVIRKLRDTLARETRDMRAFDFHEHGETVVHEWYANILKSSQRTTTMVCNEYSRDLLCEYKECFHDFPHEHPKAFVDALNDEILQINSSNNEPSESRVNSFLRGVTDKGLVAMFATTRKRMSDVDGQISRSRESQRMAAGASILFLRVRRWLMTTVDSQLLDRFEDERRHGLEEIKQSCRHSVEQFCDITDAYYHNHIANAMRMQYQRDLKDRKQKHTHLRNIAKRLNDYRNEAEGILIHRTDGYARKILKGL